MPLSSDSMESIAERLEQAAELLRKRPDDVRRAILQIAGTEPGIPDPVYMHPDDRREFIESAAKALGVSSEELLILYRLVTGYVSLT